LDKTGKVVTADLDKISEKFDPYLEDRGKALGFVMRNINRLKAMGLFGDAM